MSRNNVRGPTSALTEFLKQSGITPTTIAAGRRAAEAQHRNGNQNEGVAGPSITRGDDEDVEMEDVQEESSSAPRRRSRGKRSNAAAAEYDSDKLDEPQQDKRDKTSKKRKLSKAAEAKLKAKEKAKAKKNKKDDVHTSEEDDDDDDPYRALSRMMGGGSASPAKPTVGNFENCAICEKQFTVTKYTMHAIPGPGLLCHNCAKESGNDPFKRPTAAKRKKVPVEKRAVVNFEDRRFPSLASLCIQILAKNIDDVDALGDIGSLNMDAISKALCRNRALTPQNAVLFYSVTNTVLTLYDATNLPSPALESLFHLNPNLTRLRLDFCGHLNDAAMDTLSTSLPKLVHLELLGPFLVRPPAWQKFFAAHPSIETFKITQSPRFDIKCMQKLKKYCASTMKALCLREIGLFDDDFLKAIESLSLLEELDIADPGVSDACSEPALQSLLERLAPTLRTLDLSHHANISDSVLQQGLARSTRLSTLIMNHTPALTDEGLAEFFNTWKNEALLQINLSRNHELGSKALISLMGHSGKRLEVLGINGWGNVDEKALDAVGKFGAELKKLDVGWVRDVDDFIVKEWVEGGEKSVGCLKLNEVKLWGCNKVTTKCIRRKGLNIHGVESH